MVLERFVLSNKSLMPSYQATIDSLGNAHFFFGEGVQGVMVHQGKGRFVLYVTPLFLHFVRLEDPFLMRVILEALTTLLHRYKLHSVYFEQVIPVYSGSLN